ncbi:MAG TPA: POTRA domain-containing protein, partial [Planctomycetota bacterium]|nr:POTRA domain-containing protein [Planctomycetota bacterium]
MTAAGPGALALCLLSLAAAAGAAPSPPQASQGEDEVREAHVEGNLAYSEEQILDYLQIQRGQPYNATAVREGIKFLWQKVRVRVDGVDPSPARGGGLSIRVRVTETPIAGSVEIRGNVEFDRKELLDAGSITDRERLDEVTAQRVRQELLHFYRDRGYVFAEVSLRIDPETRKAVYEVMEGPIVRIRSIEFEGNRAFPGSTFLGLGKHLTTSMESHGKFLFFRGSEYSERKLRQDLVALRRFYRQEGYRDAVVDVLPPRFSDDGSAVDLTIVVDEGRLYRVGSIDVVGVKALSREDVLARVKLAPGDPYTFEAFLRDLRAIQRLYRENGFPSHPSLRDSWQLRAPPTEIFREDENEALVDVTYEIVENSPKRIHDVGIAGNRVTQDRVIRRALTFFPGELIDQNEIEQSLEQLDALQYFEDTRSRTSYRFVDTPDPEWKDVEIQLAEKSTGSVIVGGGLSSNDGLFAQFIFTKKNFDLFKPPTSFETALPEIIDSVAFTGAGQTLSLSLAPGLQLSQFDLSFVEPDLFGDHLRPWFLAADAYYRVRRYDTHTEDRLGERITVGKSITKNLGFDIGLRNENIDIHDIDEAAPDLLFDQEGTNSLRSIRFGVAYTDRDLAIEPKTGLTARLDYESAGFPLPCDLTFQKATGLLRGWVPLGENLEGHPHTLMLQGRLGVAFPTQGLSDVPYSERFFLGGEGTLRGFAFRGV